MGKKSKSKSSAAQGTSTLAKTNFLPFVSVCTPTFNRRPFIPTMFSCFRNQDYPKHRMEWIIVDDGTDKIDDLIATANIEQIKYFKVDKKMALGEKRNFMHEKTKGSILVYMDDDDYYPPDRVSHAVERLMNNPQALCAGSSELYLYFKHIGQMWQGGPYGPNHATAGTFAFRKKLLETTKYESHAALAEERAFLKDYTVPFVQLDPMKSILVFSHDQNTFDKKKLLENPHPQYFKQSDKTVDMFIKNDYEADIKDFFMNRMHDALKNYEPGTPGYKPDVLVQMKQIEAEREKLEAQHREAMMKQQGVMQGGMPQIQVQQPGQPPMILNPEQIVGLLQQQQQQIQQLTGRCQELEGIVMLLQNQLTQANKAVQIVNSPSEV
jgi:glycosyltransferase involved in cell wall biosynthesis